MAVNPVPEGHSSVIPYLVVPNAALFIDFLKSAFGANEVHRTALPNGKVMHAHVRIGDSSLMIGQAPAGAGTSPTMLYMYVKDADAEFQRALQAGATPATAPADQFYGDRAGSVKDPAGNEWWIASRKEDVPDEELSRRMAGYREKTE